VHAQARCEQDARLSQARAARWVIGDEAHANSLIEQARFHYGAPYTFASGSMNGSMNGYVEGTLFRSAFFSQGFEAGSRQPRGSAWGVGAGGQAAVSLRSLGFTFDIGVGMNRPELLQIMPAAANKFELRGSGAIRLSL
jgi:hypothetical protein